MTTLRRVALGLLAVLGALSAQAQTANGPLPGPMPLFPADNWWNLDLSGAPTDPNSAAFINFIGASENAHPDFGGEESPGSDNIYGFPYVVVGGSQPKVQVQFLYDDESDGNGISFYPIPEEAKTLAHWIEGGPAGNVDLRDESDRHLLIVDADNRHLYELYNVYWDGTQWHAGSGAFFDLDTNDRRPDGWTSADAAGLAILPGLVRHDEVYGPDEIGHAFRVTLEQTADYYVFPASHQAGDPIANALPMGARLRLKASKDISGYDPAVQKIFRAMKRYGLIVADNGSNLYVSGTFDTDWDNDILNPAFHSLQASDFEVVKLGWTGNEVPTQSVQFGAAQSTVPESATSAVVTLARAGGTTGEVVVEWAASPGTAGSADFGPATTGTVTFAAGAATATLRLPLKPDTLVEGPESVLLEITGLTGFATVGERSTAVLTITDDDRAGRFSFAARTSTVAESGPVAVVTVRRTDGVGSGVSVSYEATDATAEAGQDYGATAGVLEFGAGVTTRTFTVPILDDGAPEGPETLDLALVGATGGATLGTPSTAVLTITENDATVQFDSASFSASEGVASALVAVRRHGPLSSAATVSYATADGTATAPDCYLPASGVLSFAPGVAVRTFAVPIVPDTVHEPDETVLLALSSPSGAALGPRSTAVLTLKDNDKPGLLQFGAATYSVAEAGGMATITVTRSLGSASGITVDYATADGTGVAGADYTAVSGTLSFGAGVTRRTFTVPILPNAAPGGDATVALTLSNPGGGASLGPRSAALLKIVADDPTLSFAQPAVQVAENAGSATILVRRSGPTAPAVSVDYGTADGTAQAGADYTAVSSTLDFGPGVASRSFTVPVLPDDEVEPAETVALSLFGAVGGGVGTVPAATLTIATSNPAVQFSAPTSVVAEGAASAVVNVRRLAPATATVTVVCQVSDGTAVLGEDYQAPVSSVLTFAPGVTLRPCVIPLLNDTANEGPETVNLQLASPGGGARLGTPAQAVLTIAGNDAAGALEFSVRDFSAAEGAAFATVTIVRSAAQAGGVTVDLVAAAGTAVAGTDFVAATQPLTFAAGETSKTVTVELLDDDVADGNRTVSLSLAGPGGGATLGPRSTATLWLVDDDN